MLFQKWEYEDEEAEDYEWEYESEEEDAHLQEKAPKENDEDEEEELPDPFSPVAAATANVILSDQEANPLRLDICPVFFRVASSVSSKLVAVLFQ